jgi:uncharacterized protein (TIGR02996 family)
MVIAIVMLSLIAVSAILLVGRNHLIAAAPNLDQMLRSRWRTPIPGPLFVVHPTVPAPLVPPPRPAVEPPAAKSWHVHLADDREEDAMLAELRAHPNDALQRMVYADWLEDRGFVARASFVRGTEELADQHDVVDTTSVAWRAVVSHERVSCCGRQWDDFEPIVDDELARRCPRCHKTGRYLEDVSHVISCRNRGEVPVFDVAFTISRPTRPTSFPFDLSSL